MAISCGKTAASGVVVSWTEWMEGFFNRLLDQIDGHRYSMRHDTNL
jgi:hypothetical protein